MGLPSAIEGTRLVDDGLAREGRLNEKGKESRRGSAERREDEATEGGLLWREDWEAAVGGDMTGGRELGDI